MQQIQLSVSDILYAALLALFITWLIQTISKSFRVVISKPAEFNYNPSDTNQILQRCYSLFPKDSIRFHGHIFKRGMNVRITTNQHRIIEGQLIGQNNENMICVLTNRYVVAHDLENIEEILQIENNNGLS